MRVVFSREAGRTTALHLDVMPVSARKQPALTDPKQWIAGSPTVGSHTIAGGARRQ
jgi:hypothetical protein